MTLIDILKGDDLKANGSWYDRKLYGNVSYLGEECEILSGVKNKDLGSLNLEKEGKASDHTHFRHDLDNTSK